nr:FtsX-like permease family protein [uncultured Ralstonia sp.]
MQLIMLAWRNLLRNRRRTLATLLTMIVGMVGILLFGGFNRAVQYGLETAFVRGLGHLQIQHRDYLQYGSGNPTEYALRDYRRIQQTIAADPILAPMLTAATPILNMGGVAGHYATGASRPVFVQGTEPEGQNLLRHWDAHGVGAPFLPSGLTDTAPNAAILGRSLAITLGLPIDGENSGPPPTQTQTQMQSADVAPLPSDLAALVEDTAAATEKGNGDARIELLTATAAGAPNVGRLQVVGLERQGARELDDIYVGLHLAQAQRLLYGNGEPMATAVILQLRDTSMIPAARARLEHLFQNGLSTQPLAVHDFATLQPLYGRIVDMFGLIFGFVTVLIACVALFTVSNTMNMAVMERTLEIGTLRSIGLRRGGIQRLFLCEGALLGALGCACGLLISLASSWLINHAGMTWLPPGVTEPSQIVIRIWGEPRLILTTTLGLVAVALLSSWLPARRAARANIVTALRHA